MSNQSEYVKWKDRVLLKRIEEAEKEHNEKRTAYLYNLSERIDKALRKLRQHNKDIETRQIQL